MDENEREYVQAIFGNLRSGLRRNIQFWRGFTVSVHSPSFIRSFIRARFQGSRRRVQNVMTKHYGKLTLCKGHAPESGTRLVQNSVFRSRFGDQRIGKRPGNFGKKIGP